MFHCSCTSHVHVSHVRLTIQVERLAMPRQKRHRLSISIHLCLRDNRYRCFSCHHGIVVATAASKNIGPAGRGGRRTVVRDPRKAKKKKATRTTPISPRTATTTASSEPAQQHHHPHHDHIHNDPTLHNKMKLPSPLFPAMTHTTTNLHADPTASCTTSATLVTYMVAGSGVALGVTLVGVILKGLGL